MGASTAEIPVTGGDDKLHLRPMQVLVDTASAFASRVTVSRGRRRADAKSIFEVMMLATETGPLDVSAEGDDADRAVAALVERMAAEFSK